MSAMKTRIRKRLQRAADSRSVTGSISTLIARHIRKLHAATRWEFHGRDLLEAEVTAGQPVIIVLWHGRLTMAPTLWESGWGPLCVVTSSAWPGRMVGHIMRHFGHDTISMHDRKANTTTSLQVARMTRKGISISFAPDGPEGPAHVAKSVAIDWSRLTGAPIWLMACSTERYRRVDSWDKLMIPKRGGRGVMMYRKWDAEIPKKLDAEGREVLRLKFQADLDALTLEADQLMGHDGLIN